MIAWSLAVLLSTASAEVPEADWAPLVSEEVLLVNPAGKQIQGVLLSAEGESIVIRRLSDEREFTIPKSEVETVGLLHPPTEARIDVEQPLGALKDTTTEVVDSAKDSTTEAVRETLGVEEKTDEPEVVVLDEEAPVLDRPVLGDGKTYAEGLRAGRLDAQTQKIVQPFLISGGVTCCATAGPCLLSPVFGGCLGLAAGAAGPVYFAGVRPYTIKADLNKKVADEPTEFAAGYVRGYTDEVQRRETLMAAAGAGTGFLVGAGIGLVGFVVVSGL
ncbi:MAG TPA: hypothetical protein QGF58_12920 [Myxococcota bacterium]|nr:hypothetical protein [Myxococcota bacterium]